MSEKEKTVQIIKEVEKLGYNLFGEDPKHFVDRLNINTNFAMQILENYKKYKGIL